jgi:two-component system phosphate regulon sensor histidine kinase PhoR
MALLVAVLALLEDNIVEGHALAGQRAALALALDAYATATDAPGSDYVAEAERVGAQHGSRLQELPRRSSSVPGDALRTERRPGGETLVTLTRTLPNGRRFQVQDVQHARQLIHASVRELLLVGGLAALAVGALLIWGLTRALIEPARDLTKVADSLAAGNLRVRTRSTRRDELGSIGRALDRLAGQLEDRQATLRAQEDRLTTMLDSMAEAVFVTDGQGMIDLTNDALDDLVEIEPLGRTIIEVIRDADLHDTVMDAISADRREGAREVAFDYAVGPGLRHFVAQVAPLEHGTGAIGVIHDVTRHVAADRVRRDFIANASHELRTPVTAIRGYAETLAGGASKDPAMTSRFLDVILRHAGRLEALVDDMVTLSRAESERSEVERSPVSLTAAALEVVEGLSGMADGKSISVSVAELGDLPDALANPRGVDQVLINLVDNAIKYTPSDGRVWLRGEATATHVSLSVFNSGPGIPSKHVARVFERFYRVDAGRSREIGGTGLGLAIVKHLTATMGGSIDVASRADETRFTVTFPRASPT